LEVHTLPILESIPLDEMNSRLDKAAKTAPYQWAP